MNPAARNPVVLLTDFGDGYFQGVMKGVILTRAPGAIIVDLDHHIPPGAVAQAAYVLSSAFGSFPVASVFVCVVDPGVGSSRRRIVVEHPSGRVVVAPDNGLAGEIIRGDRACVIRELANPAWFLEDDTTTFEGRSRFAPAGATLAAGAHVDLAGPIVVDPVLLPGMGFERRGDVLDATVVYVDSFGNLVSSVDRAGLATFAGSTPVVVEVGPAVVRGVSRTYSEVAPHAMVAYIGSTGHLEVAVRDGNAAQRLRVSQGQPLHVRRSAGAHDS